MLEYVNFEKFCISIHVNHSINFRGEFRSAGPLIIAGPILVITGLLMISCSIELALRLRRQIKRVMDPNLLKTNNFHEVKHWVEPGE